MSDTKICYVSSAFNEEKNIWPLYQRCLASFENVKSKLSIGIEFKMILLNNNSQDNTLQIMKEVSLHDSRVCVYHNQKTYFNELSSAYGISKALDQNSDLIINLHSDLQDPPEFTESMISTILDENSAYDAVIAYKTKSNGNKLIRTFRKIYYIILKFSDRDSNLIKGFHGFGCFSRNTAKNAIWNFENTNVNLRSALSIALVNPKLIPYAQMDRESGNSSYSFISYFNEAIDVISKGKSLTTRLSLRFGLFLFFLSIAITFFVVINTLIVSNYAPGIPTLTVLIMLGFSTQTILLSMISRQLENIRLIQSPLSKVSSKLITK